MEQAIKRYKDVKIVSREDMLNSDVATYLHLMVQDYVREARDIATTPEETWNLIRDSVLNADLASILIMYHVNMRPHGFMYCRMHDTDEDTALIHCAYSRPHTPVHVVEHSLELFNDWARFHGARHGMFYTFRVPGAHRLMIQRGWKHSITTYRKEL